VFYFYESSITYNVCDKPRKILLYFPDFSLRNINDLFLYLRTVFQDTRIDDVLRYKNRPSCFKTVIVLFRLHLFQLNTTTLNTLILTVYDSQDKK
jgi:hypothetical protein